MAVVISSGTSTVSSGMILSSPSILSAGSVWVTSGGKVVSANVYSSGHENIYSGGIDSGASIYNYGSMRIALSGSAVNPCVASGGVINVDEGAVRSAVVLSRGLLNVSGRSSAAGITRGYAYNTVVSGGSLFANQYATISNTLINNRGIVSLCGVAESTTIGLSGHLHVSSGGKASNTVVDSGGFFWVYSGGTANNNRVSAGGYMYIAPGGFAYNNYISSGVELGVNNNGIVLSTTVYDSGRVIVYSGGFASETMLSSGTLVVNESATADMVTVYNGGFVVISSGATGSGIKENGGYVNVQSGANVQFQANKFSANITHDATVHKYTVASAATVYSGGRLNVLSGGEATSVFANFSGRLNVSSGGRAMNTTVNNSGTLNLSSGGTAEYTLVNNGGTMNFYDGGRDHRTTVSGTLNVSSGGTAYETTVFGKANVFSDGVMSSATVSSGGTMNVSSGGSAVRTTTFGTMLVGYRGIASRVNVVSNGSLVVSYGGKVTGELSFASGGSASFQSGGILDFDITSRSSTTSSVALVKDLSLVTGTPTYTLTVKDDQTEASYVLAKNAAGFNKTISVVNAAGSTLGTLAVGSTSKIGGVDYTLNLDSDSVLSVTVGSGSDVITGDITSETKDVTSGRRAVSANIYSAGILNVYSGGTADMTVVYSSGSLNVAGGSAQNTSVQSGGRMTVSSGGSAFNTQISSGGLMEVYGPGSAMDVTMYGGSLYISSGSVFGLNLYGGSVQNDFLVSSGTIAGGMLHVGAFGSATNLLVSGGLVNVFLHGYFNGIVTESGVLRVASAAEVYDTTVESGGRIAGMIQVNRGGLTFGAGGILEFDITVAAPGGEALVTNYSLIGGTPDCVLTVSDTLEDGTYTLATGAAGFSETITVYSTDGFTVEYAGEITVGQTITVRGKDYSLELNGSTLSVVVAGGGDITGDITDEEISVSSGMFAHDVIINEEGILNIKDGGEVSNAFINYGGSLEVSSGGVGSGITVNQDGLLHIYSGGVATGIKENGGTVILPDDYAPGTFLPNTITGLLLEDSYWLFATVHSGTVANMTTIDKNGTLIVYSGGVANHTPVYDGGSLKLSGGTANQVFVSEGASFELCGGSASEVFVYEGGTMVIKNGLAEGVETDGELHVSTGGSIIGFTMLDGTTIVEGTIEGGSIEGGTLEITNSGLVTGLTVSGGNVIAGNGGWFNGTVLDGGVVRTESTAVLNGVTVESGGKVTGSIYLYDSFGSISFLDGGILDFDISGVSPWSDALVNNLSLIDGTPDFTLTVSDSQVDGAYSLAGGASAFSGTITVKSLAGDNLGTLTVGQTTTILGKDYSLSLNADPMTGDVLTVTVSGEPVPPTPDWSFFNGDFNADGFAMLAVETSDVTGTAMAPTVTIYMNGEPWGLGLSLDPGWEVVGTGDFNGDSLDDFLRVNTEGYVVGEMSNGNGTFTAQVLNLKSAGWDILGTGDFNGNGTDDILIANPTGASETVGLLGYWESGVTWTLINGYSAEWECVSTGDFNADGKCDMLWRNSFTGEGDLVYNAYCTWIVEDPVDWRMVSVANPREWNFLCSGDFDGNGSHDIAMINDVGVVGIWGVSDGYLSSWSILSAVDRSTWTLAGVGDFNGDGTDDIAWASDALGQAGAWLIEDKQLSNWQVLANLS